MINCARGEQWCDDGNEPKLIGITKQQSHLIRFGNFFNYFEAHETHQF